MTESLPYLNAYLRTYNDRKLIEVGSRWKGSNHSSFCADEFVVTNIQSSIVYYEYESDGFPSDIPLSRFIDNIQANVVFKLNV